ncbi:MAG TPA: hypothetical protein VFV83_05220, partial [Chthoniobacteraceae bacterium]|nr:hypothetical protein [Chthoniobacteraceae bacterium]
LPATSIPFSLRHWQLRLSGAKPHRGAVEGPRRTAEVCSALAKGAAVTESWPPSIAGDLGNG